MTDQYDVGAVRPGFAVYADALYDVGQNDAAIELERADCDVAF